jgi:ribosomal protein S14
LCGILYSGCSLDGRHEALEIVRIGLRDYANSGSVGGAGGLGADRVRR